MPFSHNNSPVQLPPRVDGKESLCLPDSRQISLVGAPGAGKTRFMLELTRLCGDRAYTLSALGAEFPRGGEAEPGSIDALFNEAVRMRPYMRTDAASQIDKLAYMLIADELDYLMEVKEKDLAGKPGARSRLKTTRLDCLRSLWERVFPGNRIIAKGGALTFATESGDDLIPASRLSHGERAALYYIAGVLYAMPDAVIFIDNPSLFLHPSNLNSLWNAIEELRPDCTFVYDSVDMDFVSSRTHNVCVWIKSYDSSQRAWDYEILTSSEQVSDDLFVDLIGTRKPILFIEGDAQHSIDAKLYTLVFTDYTVRPLGSCNKVIETVRSFSDLNAFHHLDCHGIVDRDRRSDQEVGYLRRKNIFVPEVAEVENIFLLEDVISTMAMIRKRSPERVVAEVRRKVMKMFAENFEQQALQHVRHKVKREVECKIDARFTCITAMETHLKGLVTKLRPRDNYNALRTEFSSYIDNEDYAAVLKVFNHKPMLANCGVATMLGYPSADAYISGVLSVMKGFAPEGNALRMAIKGCFGLRMDESYMVPLPPPPPKRPRHRSVPVGNDSDQARANEAAATRRELRKQRKRRKREKKKRTRTRRRDNNSQNS